jgi:DNA-binding NtrC family response regulator
VVLGYSAESILCRSGDDRYRESCKDALSKGGAQVVLHYQTHEMSIPQSHQSGEISGENSQRRVFLGMTAIVISPVMTRVLETAQRVARSNATVLVTGESGAGKEVVARAIHHYSLRTSKPWVDLSCAALPEHLLESELFGYDKGAFSGADASKPGLFELAHQGTIFLDEIGELDPRMQVKLLRVLDGTPYYRLGGVRKVTADVRVVVATNQDLERAVAEGKFRRDLYHRLSQFVIKVPPLRDRLEDIGPLARYILEQEKPELRFSGSAMKALYAYQWPGNIRELRNVVLQAAVMTRGEEIEAEDLTICSSPTAGLAPLEQAAPSLDGMERRMIMDALAATNGHQQRAADRLGISRRTLSRKLKLYESEREGATL